MLCVSVTSIVLLYRRMLPCRTSCAYHTICVAPVAPLCVVLCYMLPRQMREPALQSAGVDIICHMFVHINLALGSLHYYRGHLDDRGLATHATTALMAMSELLLLCTLLWP